MALFTRRRDRELAAQRIAAVKELTDLIRRTVDENNPVWHCTTCATAMGHLPDCPDRDRPFPPSEDDEPYEPHEPTIMAYLPLDWQDRIEQQVTDQATRQTVLDIISAWENPDALTPGDAYLEGIEDAYGMSNAYLWGAASVQQNDAARAALIKAGATAYDDAREYRAMRRRLYPHRRPGRTVPQAN